jgi:hypothetical protein
MRAELRHPNRGGETNETRLDLRGRECRRQAPRQAILQLAVRGHRHLGEKKSMGDREDAEVLSVVFSVSSKGDQIWSDRSSLRIARVRRRSDVRAQTSVDSMGAVSQMIQNTSSAPYV